MSSCFYHASKEAVGYCINCGRLVCATCNNSVEGKSYCPRCVEKLFPAGKPEEKPLSEPVKPEPVTPVVAMAEPPAKMAEGKPVSGEAVYRESQPASAAAVTPTSAATSKGQTEKMSFLWWLMPVFLGWIGGLVAWLLNKKRDPGLSRIMLFTGIGLSLVQVIVLSVILTATVLPSLRGSTPNPPAVTQNVPGQEKASSSQQPSQTGEGLTSGRFGTGIEIMPVPEVAPPPAPEPPSYKLTPLISQTVEPSSESQSVNYEDKVTVKIPANTIHEPQQLTISAVTNAPSSSSDQQPLAIYDISFEKQHQFENELEFAFTYDPADIPEGYTAETSLGVSCWDEETRAWVPMQFSVDAGRQALVVSTNYNGLWEVHQQQMTGKVVLITDHFILYFKPSDFKSPQLKRYWELKRQMPEIKAGKLPKWTPEIEEEFKRLREDPGVVDIIPQGAYQGGLPAAERHLYSDNPGVPKLVVDIAFYAEEAWEAYKNAFGKEPIMSSISVQTKELDVVEMPRGVASGTYHAMPATYIDTGDYSTTFTRFPIYIDAGYSDLRYYARSKSISTGFTAIYQIKEFINHELFHAIQNKDYWLAARQTLWGHIFNLAGLKSIDEWWMEATADYAAFKIANSLNVPTNHQLDANYIAVDFFTNYYPNSDHAYENAWFLDYLVNQHGVNFADMYNRVAAYSNPEEGLDAYLKDKVSGGGSQEISPLSEMYRQFVEYLLFDPGSPYLKGESLSVEKFPSTITEQTYSVSLKGLSAKYVGIQAEAAGQTGSRSLQLSVINPQPVLHEHASDIQYMIIDIYRLRDNLRGQQKPELLIQWDFFKDDNYSKLGDIKLCDIDLRSNDVIYAVVTAFTTSSIRVDLKLEEQGSLGIDMPVIDKGADGVIGEQYEFAKKSTGIPSAATYSWYIDGQDTGKTGEKLNWRFSKFGTHTVKVKATWGGWLGFGKKTKESVDYPFAIGQPQLSIEKSADSGMIFEQQSFGLTTKYIPNGAQYSWYVGKQEIDGDQNGATYTFKEAGTYTIIAKAEWTAPEGDTQDVSAQTTFKATGGDIKITADPATGMVGRSSTFTLASALQFAPGTVFDWNFGKETGGLTATSADSGQSWVFDEAGTYPITVTAKEKNGKIIAKGALKYDVRPDLRIIPPPGIEENQGVSGVKYFFSLDKSGFPASTKYRWYVNGKYTGEGEHSWLTFNAVKVYTVKVVAIWSDGKGKEQQVDDQYSLNIRELSISIIAPGKMGVTGQAYTFGAKYDALPPGAKVEWYFEDGKKYQGDSATHTFTSTGDKPVKVQITPATGTTPLAHDEMVFKVTSYAIKILSPLAAGEKGESGKNYVFTLDTSKIPSDAKVTYAWYVNGSLVASGARLNVTSVMEGTYNIQVVCNVSSGTDSIKLEDSLVFVVGQAAAVQIIPRGGTGEVGKAYTFAALSSGIPAGARYEWSFEEGKKYQGPSATHTFTSAGDKTVVVMVYAGNDPEPLARDEVIFRITAGTPAATVKIKLPVTVGVIGATYNFDTTTSGIPANASYTWDFGDSTGQVQGKTVQHAYKTAGDFPVKVVASWVEGGKSRQLADSATMKIAASEPAVVKKEVNFAVWRWKKSKFKDEIIKSKQYCQDYSINIYRVEGGKNVLADSGSSYYRNGAFESTLPVGHYMYEVNYKYVDPGADSGRRTGYFDVTGSGSNLVDVETPPYESYI